jgi:xanthomonalisin
MFGQALRRVACAVASLGSMVAGPALAAPVKLLSAHVPAAVAQHVAKLLGAADPGARMKLAVALPLRAEAALDAVLRDIYDPTSPNYRHYLSVAEFTARFGPTEADYTALQQFLAGQGLTIVATSPNRYLVDVEGSVADVQRAFHVSIGLYRHPTEDRIFFAPDREPTVDLAVPISHVTGLDNFELPRPRAVRRRVAGARGTGSAPGGDFLGSDIRTAYYGGHELTGAGQSVGLMELEGYHLKSVKTYFAQVGQPLTVPVIGIDTDGAHIGCTDKCNDVEQALDIEYAISMAPGLKQLQVYVGSSPEDVLNRMASDNTSAQLSTSWGWEENFATDDPLLKEMAVQGQTFLTASGDYSSLKASGPWPEEDANLTAVGGTDLTTAGPGGAWSAETGWQFSAGGPSVDPTILIPFYQTPYVTKGNHASATLRNVPDIAGDGNEDNYICWNQACEGGWGGTSFASPIWAGFIALANERAAKEGKPRIGFLNPTLYRLGIGPANDPVLHDELLGRSGAFRCRPSFDLVTGFGSPRGEALIRALAAGQ